MYISNVLQESALRRTSPALVFDSSKRTARYRRRVRERDMDVTRTAGRRRWASRSPERGAQSKPDNEPAGGGSAVVYVEVRPLREPARSWKVRGFPVLGNKSRRDLPGTVRGHAENTEVAARNTSKKERSKTRGSRDAGGREENKRENKHAVNLARWQCVRPDVVDGAHSACGIRSHATNAVDTLSSSSLPLVCMCTVCSGTRVWPCCTWPVWYLLTQLPAPDPGAGGAPGPIAMTTRELYVKVNHETVRGY